MNDEALHSAIFFLKTLLSRIIWFISGYYRQKKVTEYSEQIFVTWCVKNYDKII
jgi:hypothetical protein